jgi:hypothetical protein
MRAEVGGVIAPDHRPFCTAALLRYDELSAIYEVFIGGCRPVREVKSVNDASAL